MYSQTMINNLKIVRESLWSVEGENGPTYKLVEEVMQEVQDNLENFGDISWSYDDIESLLEQEGITLAKSEIVALAEIADKRIREAMTDAGWEVLNELVSDYVSNQGEE